MCVNQILGGYNIMNATDKEQGKGIAVIGFLITFLMIIILQMDYVNLNLLMKILLLIKELIISIKMNLHFINGNIHIKKELSLYTLVR